MITFLIHTLPLCLRRMTPEGNGAALPVYRILPLLLLIPPGRVSMPASRVCPVYFHAPYSVYTLLRPESTPPSAVRLRELQYTYPGTAEQHDQRQNPYVKSHKHTSVELSKRGKAHGLAPPKSKELKSLFVCRLRIS